jgi:DNA-binding CsgD family transcriptional regulator
VKTLRASCYKSDEATPYAPLATLLAAMQEGGGAAERPFSTNGLHPRSDSDWRALDVNVRGRRARFLGSASRTLTRAFGAGPTVLCVEDLQWADEGTLLVLNRLLDERPLRLLLVCTLRRDAPEARAGHHLVSRIERRSRRINLAALSLSDTRELLHQLAGDQPVSEAEIRTLRALTNGNPLFLREWYAHLLETGLLTRHTLAEAASRSRTPPRLSAVIDARLASTPTGAKRTLATLAVVGVPCGTELLAHIANEDADTVRSHLESATGRGILHVTDAIDGGRFAFAHALLARRMYETMAPAERRRLHTAIAEAGWSASAAFSDADLARHFALGSGARGDGRAVECCRTAAEAAEAVLAFESAARCWEFALQCTPLTRSRARADLLGRTGWALWAATKWQLASEAWSEAIQLYERLGLQEEAAPLMLALGDVFRWRLELSSSERWLTKSLACRLPRAIDRARANALLASIYCVRRETARGLALLKEARELADREGGDPLVNFWAAYGLLMAGDITTGLELGRTALARAREIEDAHAVSLLAGLLFHVELSALNIRGARLHLRALKEVADASDVVSQSYVLVNSAWLLALTGRWHAVVRLCDRWIATMRFAGPYQIATARCLRAEARLALGDPSAACNDLRLALPDLDAMRSFGELELAYALATAGDSASADHLVRSYLEATESPPPASVAALFGRAVSSINAPDLWEQAYELLKPSASRLALIHGPICVQRVLGRLSTRLRRWAAAELHFESALCQLRTAGAQWELARTYVDYAEMRRARNRRGDRQKAAAAEWAASAIFERLGVTRQSDDQRAHVLPAIPFGLSSRELEVLLLVAQGRRNPEIAEALTISARTVERHLENLFAKIGVRNRTEAVVEAARSGLLAALPVGVNRQREQDAREGRRRE